MEWTDKLLQFGIPYDLAVTMSQDLQTIPYAPEQFGSIDQLVNVMQEQGFQSLGWWEDLMAQLQKIITLIPGFVLIGAGAVIAYALRNVKAGKIPLGLLGLVPIGIGTWVIITPFLPKTTQGA